jgi:hypothetical protein
MKKRYCLWAALSLFVICCADKNAIEPEEVNPESADSTILPGKVDPDARLATVQAFTGKDGNHYILTLLEPKKPQEGANKITAYVHSSKDGGNYALVKNVKLKIDPRMPSMGNHSSPNNVDLTWDDKNKVYQGTVNFSMTGYWKISLILLNETGEVLQGNSITADVKESSIYFEIEV